jgi:DNA-directed RNA polymerase subunit RPC12/RpoP
MGCPYCRSEYLVIRQRTGWEWVVLLFTTTRKYYCVACGQSFRAPDRRKVPRPEGKILTVRPEHFGSEARQEENSKTSSNA